MKLTTAFKAGMLALALAAAAAPAAAHGAINYETRYYSNGQMVGQAITYCDGHQWAWGDLTQLDNEFIFYGCD